MYILLIIIIVILSLFSTWEKVWNFLLRHKKYVSGFLYLLAFLSLWYLTDTSDEAIYSAYQFWELNFWFLEGSITHFAYAFIALMITIGLTMTSNTFSIKKLWKYWKKIHRFVYALLLFGFLHVFFVLYWTEEFIPAVFKYGVPLILYIIWKTLEWKNITLRKPE